jgi:hypothetical protein
VKILFLSTVKTKGNYYVYLRSYAVNQQYVKKVKTNFKFGRKEIAIKKLHHWKENFGDFPKELIDLGCNVFDLEDWIRTFETGITKTGKQFKATT